VRSTPSYFTDEQIAAAIAAWGLPDRCTDPDTLRAAARVEAAAARRIAAEREAAEREAAASR
jgi:hypothetical protein